jgi:hypothetical protein
MCDSSYSVEIEDKKTKIALYHTLLAALPAHNRVLLTYLLSFLGRVLENSKLYEIGWLVITVIRNKVTVTHLGRTFGPLFFFASEDPRAESSLASNVAIFLLSDFKKLLITGNEEPPKQAARNAVAQPQAASTPVEGNNFQRSELVSSPS